ncbi:MAG: hypothetical protein WC310_03630 [Patescibacteria group bacterium]|jgi:hypothetical protein
MKVTFLKILYDVFSVSAVSWAVCVVSETIKPGFVTNYLDMNIFLLWTVIIGIIYTLMNKN